MNIREQMNVLFYCMRCEGFVLDLLLHVFGFPVCGCFVVVAGLCGSLVSKNSRKAILCHLEIFF